MQPSRIAIRAPQRGEIALIEDENATGLHAEELRIKHLLAERPDGFEIARRAHRRDAGCSNEPSGTVAPDGEVAKARPSASRPFM